MTSATLSEPEASRLSSTANAGKYLTFQMSAEIYGLDILAVQEIIGMIHVTRVPRTREYLRGIINLRGKVIPVMDMRLKFGLSAQEDSERTCVIVVKLEHGGQLVIIGMIVDAVAEVIDISEEQIEPAPTIGNSLETNYIQGIGKVGDRVVVLLDVCKVIEDEISSLSGGSVSHHL